MFPLSSETLGHPTSRAHGSSTQHAPAAAAEEIDSIRRGLIMASTPSILTKRQTNTIGLIKSTLSL